MTAVCNKVAPSGEGFRHAMAWHTRQLVCCTLGMGLRPMRLLLQKMFMIGLLTGE
jgi:hypothetical protein